MLRGLDFLLFCQRRYGDVFRLRLATYGDVVYLADPQAIKPGRDPRQPIDSAYTKKIREYTTETFRSS